MKAGANRPPIAPTGSYVELRAIGPSYVDARALEGGADRDQLDIRLGLLRDRRLHHRGMCEPGDPDRYPHGVAHRRPGGDDLVPLRVLVALRRGRYRRRRTAHIRTPMSL